MIILLEFFLFQYFRVYLFHNHVLFKKNCQSPTGRIAFHELRGEKREREREKKIATRNTIKRLRPSLDIGKRV